MKIEAIDEAKSKLLIFEAKSVSIEHNGEDWVVDTSQYEEPFNLNEFWVWVDDNLVNPTWQSSSQNYRGQICRLLKTEDIHGTGMLGAMSIEEAEEVKMKHKEYIKSGSW